MNHRRKGMVVNWIMLIALLTAFVTGILLKCMPGMWMGIAHALSGIALLAAALLHIVQQRMFARR